MAPGFGWTMEICSVGLKFAITLWRFHKISVDVMKHWPWWCHWKASVMQILCVLLQVPFFSIRKVWIGQTCLPVAFLALSTSWGIYCKMAWVFFFLYQRWWWFLSFFLFSQMKWSTFFFTDVLGLSQLKLSKNTFYPNQVTWYRNV